MSERRVNSPARRRARRLAGVALALGSLLVSACGSTPAGGDPGGRRLHELANDGVFAAAPEGAADVHVVKTPARYRKPGFSGGGWDGPSVVVTFRSSAAPAEVFRFYGGRAAASGWRATSTGGLGVTDTWAKTYADGADATLLLSQLPGGAYRLSGGIAPVPG